MYVVFVVENATEEENFVVRSSFFVALLRISPNGASRRVRPFGRRTDGQKDGRTRSTDRRTPRRGKSCRWIRRPGLRKYVEIGHFRRPFILWLHQITLEMVSESRVLQLADIPTVIICWNALKDVCELIVFGNRRRDFHRTRRQSLVKRDQIEPLVVRREEKKVGENRRLWKPSKNGFQAKERNSS